MSGRDTGVMWLVILLLVAVGLWACGAAARQPAGSGSRAQAGAPTVAGATIPVVAPAATVRPVGSVTSLPLIRSASPPLDLPFMGLNYPWHQYGHDFGANAWGHDGVSSTRSRPVVEADFAAMRRHGVEVVRWFVWADGRASPEFDQDGYVTGLDEAFYADLDAALAIAAQNDIALLLVLFDYRWFDAPEVVDGVQLFGRATTLTDPAKRRSLLDKALLPLLARYGAHERIIWEVINEPEGAMHVPQGNRVPDAVSAREMQTLVGEIVTLIHTRSSRPVTLGSASHGSLPYWTESGLDVYQYHFYDQVAAGAPLEPPCASLGLDRSVLVGEFPTRGRQRGVDEYLDSIWRNGCVAAFPWSYRGNDEASDFAGQAAAYCAWARDNLAGREDLDCPPPLTSAPQCPANLGSPHGSVPLGDRACSPDGTRYARELEPVNQGQIGIFDEATDRQLLVINADEQNNELKGLAWSPDSRWVAYMFHHNPGGYIVIVDGETGRQARRIAIDEWYHRLEFTPDGTGLLVGAWNIEPRRLEAWE